MAEIKVKHLDNEIQDKKPDIEIKEETTKTIDTNLKWILMKNNTGLIFYQK